MQLREDQVPSLRARVLFVRADGVLFASEGSPEMTRRYVWAPMLERLLVPYPDVCLVVLASRSEAVEDAKFKRSLGQLGQRVIDVLASDVDCLTEVVSGWLRHHPEVVDSCVLTSSEVGPINGTRIMCDAAFGINTDTVISALSDWLHADQCLVA